MDCLNDLASFTNKGLYGIIFLLIFYEPNILLYYLTFVPAIPGLLYSLFIHDPTHPCTPPGRGRPAILHHSSEKNSSTFVSPFTKSASPKQKGSTIIFPTI